MAARRPPSGRPGGAPGRGARLGRIKQPRRVAPVLSTGPRLAPPTRNRPWRPPDPPSGWPSSLPEWWVYWWLTSVRHLTAHRDFEHLVEYQGGMGVPGGREADFVITS